MRASRPVRIEFGITTAESTECQELASAIHQATGVAVVACPSYHKAVSAAVASKNRWMLSPSPSSHRHQPTNGSKSSFRLISTWIQSDNELLQLARFMQKVEAMEDSTIVAITTNKVVGVRVHVLARGLTCRALARLSQLFVKYEMALDCLVPESRRTGSTASQKFFRSNRLALNVASALATGGGTTSSTSTTTTTTTAASIMKEQLNLIESCNNTESLVEVINPRDASYKLNLRTVVKGGTQEAYIEFRQHSITSNHRKLQSWVAILDALVLRASSLRKAPLAFRSSTSLDEQVKTLFATVVKDPGLRTYYQKRRAQLQPKVTRSANAKQPKKAKLVSSSTTAANPASGATTVEASNTSKTKKENSANQMCACCFQKLQNVSGNNKSKLVCACQERGHVFCASCIRKYAHEELFTNNNGRLTCISIGGKCTSEYRSRQLEEILPDNAKQKLWELQYVERCAKKQGNVMCECPKCGTQGLIPKKETTFSCPLASCRFHSCRRCGEEAHPNLSCAQVEKKTVRNARTSVEEAMSRERIRNCPQCHTPIVLEAGCNNVACSRCRTTFCYNCGSQPCRCSLRRAYSGDITYRNRVREAGTSALDRVDDMTAQQELTGIVDRLI